MIIFSSSNRWSLRITVSKSLTFLVTRHAIERAIERGLNWTEIMDKLRGCPFALYRMKGVIAKVSSTKGFIIIVTVF